MKNKSFLLILGGLGIITVITFIVLSAKQFGFSYSESLSKIAPILPDAPQTREKRRVRRITVKNETGGCIEITPDGVVRSYTTCGGEPTDVHRLADPKRILQLIEIMSQVDTSKYAQPGPDMLTIVVETDLGTVTLYVPTTPGGGGSGGGGGDSISDIIDLITGDLPQPTQTPAVVNSTPTPTIPGTVTIPTNTPLPTLPPWITPTITPTPGDQPFTCGFTATGSGPKPYNVSNYICTTKPSPYPTPTL